MIEQLKQAIEEFKNADSDREWYAAQMRCMQIHDEICQVATDEEMAEAAKLINAAEVW